MGVVNVTDDWSSTAIAPSNMGWHWRLKAQ
jgi:hypothetical protein